MADIEVAAKVTLRIPATFYAHVLVGPNGEARIEKFTITPLESDAGYFGPGVELESFEAVDPAMTEQEAHGAAKAYWDLTNVDGDWPVDTVEWAE